MRNDGTTIQGMVYGSLAILFAFSDSADVFVADYRAWLVVDYAVRLAMLGAVCLLIRRNRLAWRDIGLGPARKDFVLAGMVIVTALSFIICTECLMLFSDESYQGIGSIPVANNHLLSQFDKWIGLLFVAASEEVVFRGLALSVLKKAGLGAVKTVLVSTVVFTLTYWSHSVGSIVCFAALGVVFMVSTMVTGSLLPSITAHYTMLVLLYRG